MVMTAGRSTSRVGFLGLGHMGEPMAANLLRAGVPLTVWNRTPGKAAELGAEVAASPAEVFERCAVVIAMLANGGALDEVLGRRGASFGVEISGRTLINMGTVAPAWSRRLYDDVRAAGGHLVEAPVSGSRVPAQEGTLVAMLAGETGPVQEMVPLLEPLCASTVHCGDVPRALELKLAVNVYLIAAVTGLAEAMRFADSRGLDRSLVRGVLDAGTMASPLSRVKAAKLVDGDLRPQAAVRDVLYNNRLILDAARASGAAMPLLGVCASLFARALELGHGGDDMVAVIEAIA